MDARRQHHAVHAPLQSQQFPPLLHPQAGGQPPRQPLPLPHSYFGLGPRPSSFSGPAHPLAGQKRNSMALHHRPADGAGFAKLFVGSLPRNISEEEVRGLFGEYGNVVEVVFLKDKKTGLPQGCCFIKYETAVEAERAIRALDNQRTLQGGSAPLQVKFADGERDHPGPLEHKLFVGSLSKQATEQEIEEIFAPFGRVENVYVIRDEHKQSRGCAFVTFPDRDMAIAAISALNGVYRMAGCHQSIIVRFADPKRPRSGEASRMGGTGPNYSPHSSQGAGGPRGSGGQAMGAHSPAFGWRQGGGPSGMGLLPQTGILPLGTPVSTSVRGGPLDGPNTAMGMRAGGGSIQASQVISGPIAVSGMGAQLSQQQGFKESSFHRPGQVFGQQVSLHQQPPQQFLPSTAHHNQLQPLQGFPLAQSTDTRLQQPVPLGQYSSAQPTVQVYGQTSVSHHQLQQQVVTSIQQPITTLPSQQLQLQPPHQLDSQQNQQPIVVQTGQPLPQVQQQIPSLQQVQQQIAPLQPLPSQLQQQVVVKETSQQPYLNPLQMTSLQPVTVQPSWSVPVQQQVVTSVAAPTIASVSVTPAPVTATCEWTEHTSPEGHKYYYNSSTGESRWEKPEEFAAYEQQQQQQPQPQPQPQPQQQQQQQQQLPHHHQQQQVQAQAQAQVQTHVQQLQPQHLNYQYQQQQVLNHQPQQQAPSQQLQHYQQQHQPQMQQLHQQQPQLQQPQLQQPQQQPQLQQPQRETQFPYSGVTSLQYTQPLSGGTYQPVQGYAQGQPANGMVDPSRGAHQQFPPSQQVLAQIPSANGMPDIARGAQWIPAIQQGLPNQEWMWKSKPTGS